jgi:adenylate cyclase
VVTAIVRQKEDVNLGSTRRRITVLFSDIRGFTTMSEKMSPEEVGAFLREYFTIMTAVVFRYGGTVDKYIGDAIMALYNVPFDQPDHAEQAVRTALTFQEQLQPLAARFQAKYGADLRCGVGIHTGEAVVGTFGSEQRLEYTAIGDTVNLASRLEGITKDFNVSIVISESTFQEVQGKFPMRYLGEVKVKGKDIPVKIHAVAEKDTRTAIRAREEGTVRISDNEVAFQASVNDVTLRGLSVQGLPKELPQGQILELRLDLTMVEEPVHATAQVVWSTGGKAGLQFLDLKPRDQKTLEKFVTRQRQHL